MYSYDFPMPYPEMMVYSVIVIICLVIAGMIIKRWLRPLICPHLIPLLLVIMSFIISNLYAGGWTALFSLDINDIRAVTNGLAAIGLHQLISKTYLHYKFVKIKKDGEYKKGKKIA